MRRIAAIALVALAAPAATAEEPPPVDSVPVDPVEKALADLSKPIPSL